MSKEKREFLICFLAGIISGVIIALGIYFGIKPFTTPAFQNKVEAKMEEDNSRFNVIERKAIKDNAQESRIEEIILEDKVTGVLYLYMIDESNYSNHASMVTPLLNPDGSPMLSEKAWEDAHGR